MNLPYVFVFANYPFEVDHYRSRKGYSVSQVRFVRDVNTLRGIHFHPPVRMPFVGGFYRRNDAQELVAYAAQHGILVSSSYHPNIYDPATVHGISEKFL